MAGALRATSDEDAADPELATARAEFERLGAPLDLAAADAAIEAVTDRRAEPSQTRKTFVFTDIVGSTAIAELLGDRPGSSCWAGMTRPSGSIFEPLGGDVVTSTGDGFFVAFDEATAAVDAAAAIQGRSPTIVATVERPSPSGSASIPPEANRRGRDYTGIGVHVAARVAAMAGGGEVLATETTLAEAGLTTTATCAKPRCAG